MALNINGGEVMHVGYRCDLCGADPIRNVRFKCLDCPDYDMCEQCERTNQHNIGHLLLKIRQPIMNQDLPFRTPINRVVGPAISVAFSPTMITLPPVTTPLPNPFAVSKSPSSDIALTKSINSFGFKLFNTLSKSNQENVLISPFNIDHCLMLAANGASSSTLQAFINTLQFPSTELESINTSFRYILSKMISNHNHENSILKLASSVWARSYVEVLSSYKTAINSTFPASHFGDLIESDVNQWVSDATQGIFKNIYEDNPQILMVLISALYFKGKWEKQFDPQNTRFHSFMKRDGSSLPVQMMNITDQFSYYTDNQRIQAISLPYKAPNGFGFQNKPHLNALVLLPTNSSSYGIDQLIDQMNWDSWSFLLQNMKQERVNLTLPKFKLQYTKKLKDPLTTLGLGNAFIPGADFSRLATHPQYIGEVLHKTFVEVDEQGTVAAAVTMTMTFGGAAVSTTRTMIVDRPFLFFIYDSDTNVILFTCKIENPQL